MTSIETFIIVGGLLIFFALAGLAIGDSHPTNPTNTKATVETLWNRWQWLYYLACAIVAFVLHADALTAGILAGVGALAVFAVLARATRSRWRWQWLLASVATGLMVGIPLRH
jgi:hypothetical protein